jgi:hypothetical protein
VLFRSKQHELWDGTYTFSDLLDWHEMNDVRTENEKRWDDYIDSIRGSG